MNETLLDLGLLAEQFNKSFNDRYVLKYWFTKRLPTSVVVGAMDAYENSGDLAAVVLDNVFYERGKQLTKETKAEILGAFRSLSAYGNVFEALTILRNHSIRVVAVPNSSLDMI
jgi:2-haloacid dehalogenase